MNNAFQPLVSIVTPVYNEEEFLPECIQSVQAQSYTNWDYTIINNCSTDRTLEIARHYAAQDPRIRVHDNAQFLKMLANHNVAVRQISPASKYCKVLLGDDYIYPDCLEKMVEVAERDPSIGVVSAYERAGEQIRLTGLSPQTTVLSGREACRHFLMGTLLLFGSQTSVMYRSDLVRARDPFYVESDMFADFESCFALLRHTSLGFVHQILTFSRPRPGSIGAISSDIGAHFGSMLGLIDAYGKPCFSEDELAECLERHLSQYYKFLGRRLLVERGEEFWSYHRHTFARFGIPFRRTRLLQAAAGQLLGSIRDPKAWLASMRRLFSLRGIRNQETRGVVFESAAPPGSANGSLG